MRGSSNSSGGLEKIGRVQLAVVGKVLKVSESNNSDGFGGMVLVSREELIMIYCL